jgi:hypothetical protein
VVWMGLDWKFVILWITLWTVIMLRIGRVCGGKGGSVRVRSGSSWAGRSRSHQLARCWLIQ